MDDLASQERPAEPAAPEGDGVDRADGFLADATITRRLSSQELRELEDRARARLADPAYQRRLRKMDRIAESLIRDLEQ